MTATTELVPSASMNACRILDAVLVAAMHHDGQRDIAGLEPYVAHPLRVAEHVARIGCSEDEVIAAILHDTVEDTALQLAGVRARFGDAVAKLVDGLTKRKGERYADALRRAVSAGAGMVKLADVLDNSSAHRLATVSAIDPSRADRLRLKYAQALLTLQSLNVKPGAAP